jgi:hypothetical protein
VVWNRRVAPYALMGALTLGTGLGAGLGLASGPVIYTPSVTMAALPGSCSIVGTQGSQCYLGKLSSAEFRSFVACSDYALKHSAYEPTPQQSVATAKRCLAKARDS